jgi:hypothetical protein
MGKQLVITYTFLGLLFLWHTSCLPMSQKEKEYEHRLKLGLLKDFTQNNSHGAIRQKISALQTLPNGIWLPITERTESMWLPISEQKKTFFNYFTPTEQQPAIISSKKFMTTPIALAIQHDDTATLLKEMIDHAKTNNKKIDLNQPIVVCESWLTQVNEDGTFHENNRHREIKSLLEVAIDHTNVKAFTTLWTHGARQYDAQQYIEKVTRRIIDLSSDADQRLVQLQIMSQIVAIDEKIQLLKVMASLFEKAVREEYGTSSI